MDRSRMKQLIDKEQGEGFSDNISLDGYTFFKNDSFISFKISKVDEDGDNISVVNIRYIYSDNKNDLISVIAYACNFWIGANIKFIYYKEKKKAPYVIKAVNSLGFKVVDQMSSKDWDKDFVCHKCGNKDCECMIIEAYA